MLLSQPARKRALLNLLHVNIWRISNIRHRTINQHIPKHLQAYSSLPYGKLVLETLRFNNILKDLCEDFSLLCRVCHDLWSLMKGNEDFCNEELKATKHCTRRKNVAGLQTENLCSLTHCCMENSTVLSPRHFCKEWERNSVNTEISWFRHKTASWDSELLSYIQVLYYHNGHNFEEECYTNNIFSNLCHSIRSLISVLHKKVYVKVKMLMDSSNTCIRPMTTAQTLNRKMPKGTPGKEAIKENWKKINKIIYLIKKQYRNNSREMEALFIHYWKYS